MAAKKVTDTTTDTEEVVVKKAQGFWADYSKQIIAIGSVIILGIAGWYGYKYFIQAPKEEKANAAIFHAENLFGKMAASGFNKDSSTIVLNGGNLEGVAITGVLKVKSEFGGTKAGERASYIAGATYLHLKEFNKAIDNLEDFDANGAHQVQSKAYLMLGFAYSELNKTSEALDNYRKAANVNTKDDITSSEALLIAASYAQAINKEDVAKELYLKIKNDYPEAAAVKSGDVDKYLASLGELK